MRGVISQIALAQVLSYVQTALPTRPPLPILASLRLEATASEIIVSATDLYFGIQARCRAEIEETGVLAVPGKQLIELIKGLPAGEIHFATSDNSLEITTKHIVSTLQFQSADEFPAFPEVEGEVAMVGTDVASALLQQVAMSCSLDVARPLLTGILWEPDKTTFAATDGFRLSYWRPKVSWDLKQKLIVPARFWQETEKIALQEKKETIEIAYSTEQKQIAAVLDRVLVYSRVLEGEYPPYEKIIPADFAVTVVLQAEELLEHIRRSLLYARDSLGTIQLRFSADQSVLTAQSAALGKFEATITTAQLTGEAMTIAFNSKYILDFLQLVKSGEMQIGMNGELKPALFSTAKYPDFGYVVMPFRVHQ